MTEDPSAGARTSPADPLLHNQLGERYDVLEKLGDGPLVVSYRGRDRTLNRLVSVKTLQPAFAQNTAVRERLRNGLGRTLSLSSPRIARAYDVGVVETGGSSLLFWVEEYVRGINLKERIRRVAPFPLPAAIDTAVSLAEALEYAHSRGISHGDLRPQNVLIGPDGEMKLTGFGIADAQAIAIRDAPQSIRLNDSYSAPEMTPGSLATPDFDLYALGVILFELLTGELSQGESQVGYPPRLRQTDLLVALQASAVPRAIQGILGKATLARPSGRYDSAASLLTDLKLVRDALRSGKPLTWSPLDKPGAAVSEVPEGETFEVRTAGAVPTGSAGGSLKSQFPLSDTARRPTAAESEATAPMPVPVSQQRPVRPARDIRFVGEPVSEQPVSKQPVTADDRNSAPWAARTRDEEEKDERPLRRDNKQGDNGGGGNRYLTSLNLFLFVLVVAGLGVLGYMTTTFLKPAPEVVVPNLVGKTISVAKEMASEQKFDLAVVDEQYRESDATGVIYQMQPMPGRHIREGKPISIWVSKGPRMVDVPDVRSMTLEKARQVIENNNLKLGDYSFQYDVVEPKGNVLSQDPAAAESRPHGTHVILVLSKGEEPAPAPVPDVPAPPPANIPDDPTPAPVNPPADHPSPASSSGETGASDTKVRTFDVKYPVPADAASHRIRVDVTDRDGTRTVFDETHKAGETLKQRIEAVGKQIHIRLFDNDQLRSERVY